MCHRRRTMILCENFCTGARRAADVARTAAPGRLRPSQATRPAAPPQALAARGPRAGCRARPGHPHPGQGCCEAGKRQVRGHHRILVIRRTGTTRDGTGPRLHVHESAADPRVRARLTVREQGWYRDRRCQVCLTGARGVRPRCQGRPLTVVPAAPGLIARGDLVAALDRAAARKVTIISALAGSGRRRCCAPGPAVRGSRAGSPCCADKLMELRNAER